MVQSSRMATHTSSHSKTSIPVGIRVNFELTLPPKLKKKIAPGDFFRAEFVGSELVLRPVDAIDPTQAWFWTPEWQEKERAADDDIRAGRVSGPFRSVRAFMRGLKRAP